MQQVRNALYMTSLPHKTIPSNSVLRFPKLYKTNSTPLINIVSLFAGCGGLDYGVLGDFEYGGEYYERLPFNIIVAYDNDPKCVETYKRNLGNHAEVVDLSIKAARDMPSAEVLIGGFPCQDFSTCGPLAGLESERGQMYKAFVRYMDEHAPAVVVAENVMNLARMEDGKVLAKILEDLSNAGPGYQFSDWRLFGPNLGVPQSRGRLFLVGTRRDLPPPPPPPDLRFVLESEYRSIDWAISDLEEITDAAVPNQDQYFRASKAKRGNGQGDEISRVGKPAYTVRANARSRVQFHYRLPRRLTVRELARLQTFPDSFVFSHSATTNVWQIGNAVPPVMAHQVFQVIARYLKTII